MITYLIAIVFTLAFVFYSKYQFQNEVAGQWHIYGLIMRGAFFASMLFHHQWQNIILAFAICIVIYEVGINIIALKQRPFYLGKTSTLDKTFGRAKWLYMAAVLALAIGIKIFIK